jgi:hypothetical protein
MDQNFALAHWQRALYWEAKLGITDVGSELAGFSQSEKLARYLAAVDAAIDSEEDEILALKYRANKAFNELRLGDSRRLLERYVREYPNDIEGFSGIVETMASMRDAEGARRYLARLAQISHDDPRELNILLNNLLFVGLVNRAAELAHDVLARYPEHAFLIYQAHRVLLWSGQVAEARHWADVLRAREFPEDNIKLLMLRQACAEKNHTVATDLFNSVVNIEPLDPSIEFIALQIMNRPDEAHQMLVDAELDIYALASFLRYPYFDHRYFPELAARLEQQSINRPFISGPPYRCEAAEPTRPQS